MRPEFLTQHGKVTLKNNTLYIRNHYMPLSQTALAEVGVEIGWILLIALWIGLPFEENPAKTKARIVLLAVLTVFRLPGMYRKFFKRSWASRIPLHRIKSFEPVPDNLNLLTTVHLQLANGRVRPILFRTNESSLQAFTALLVSAQTAVAPV